MKKFVALLALCLLVLFAGSAAADVKEYKDFKLAAVFQTAIEEPWDGCIHQALLRAREELGVQYEWAESVANPDFERVVREFAGRGFDLIMGDAFGSEEAVRRAAKDFPKTAFLFGSGLKPQPPNFSVFDNWIHEPAYLSGMLAGGLTGVVVGYVADRLFIRKAGEDHLAQVLITVGIAYIIGDLCLRVWGGDAQKLPLPLYLRGILELPGGIVYPSFRIFLTAIGLVTAVALWLVYKKTTIGAAIRAGVDDRVMVSATGIHIDRLFMLISGLAAYKIGKKDTYAGDGAKEWTKSTDILARQVEAARDASRYGGFAVYSYTALFAPASEVKSSVKAERGNLEDVLS